MEEFAKTPVAKFVNEGNKKGWSIEDIVTKGQAAGYSPVDLLKGFIIQEVPLQEVIKVFLEKNLLPPCGLMKGALEAVRGMKMVEVESGHYAIVTPGMCAIEGSMDPERLGPITKTYGGRLNFHRGTTTLPTGKRAVCCGRVLRDAGSSASFLDGRSRYRGSEGMFQHYGMYGTGLHRPAAPAPCSVSGHWHSEPGWLIKDNMREKWGI